MNFARNTLLALALIAALVLSSLMVTATATLSLGAQSSKESLGTVSVAPGETKVMELTVVGEESTPVETTEETNAEETTTTPTDPSFAESCDVRIQAGEDLDAKVNNGGAGKTYCVEGGTYQVDNTVKLTDSKLIGPAGNVVERGPAFYGTDQTVLIRNSGSLTRLVHTEGTVEMKWLDLAGAEGTSTNSAGTGIAISAKNATPKSVFQFLKLHDNAATGISGANGLFANNECFRNTLQSGYIGHTGGCAKATDEFEATQNYVHDEQGFGLWCDSGCDDRPTLENGFWVHHNLVVNNAQGIRYEHAPFGLATGVKASQPTALIEKNEVHGHNRSGISMHDAQNGLIRANNFGKVTIAGVTYEQNTAGGKPRAIQFTDSGRDDRTDTYNGTASGNNLGGEAILGCDREGITCINNTP